MNDRIIITGKWYSISKMNYETGNVDFIPGFIERDLGWTYAYRIKLKNKKLSKRQYYARSNEIHDLILEKQKILFKQLV